MNYFRAEDPLDMVFAATPAVCAEAVAPVEAEPDTSIANASSSSVEIPESAGATPLTKQVKRWQATAREQKSLVLTTQVTPRVTRSSSRLAAAFSSTASL